MTAIPATEVAARWCYAELRSSRFGLSYEGLVPYNLIGKAIDGAPFDDLDAADIKLLNNALSRHEDRGSFFYKFLAQFPWYHRVKRDYAELSQLVVVPYFGTQTFANFERDPHPRVQATLDSIPLGTFCQNESIIIVPYNGREMLLEGTLRSLWFARDREPLTKIEAWVPLT
jgi:hypothetical protein